MTEDTFRYHLQTSSHDLRNGFPYFTYHDSISALWAEKWRPPCSEGIFPFMDGAVEDFDPIFTELIATSGDDTAFLYRPDDYAKPFLPVGDALVARAEQAAADGRHEDARNLFLRAAAVFRIARYPSIRSPLSRAAWAKNKAAYERGSQLLDPPSTAVDIPFATADLKAGENSFIAATRGTGKDLIVLGNRGHMGAPGADEEEIVHDWIDRVQTEKS